MNRELCSKGGKIGGVRPKHRWADEEREIVRLMYRQDNESAKAIAQRLGVSLSAVKGQVQLLGLAKRTGRKNWDNGQDDRLRELLSHYAPCTVARKMGRSINSVVVRANRLGLSRRSREGWYTKREVMEILGVDHKRIQSFIDKGFLKATWHNGHRPNKKGLAMWHIERGDLRKFICRYPQEFNGRNVDLVQMVDVLAGLNYYNAG